MTNAEKISEAIAECVCSFIGDAKVAEEALAGLIHNAGNILLLLRRVPHVDNDHGTRMATQIAQAGLTAMEIEARRLLEESN